MSDLNSFGLQQFKNNVAIQFQLYNSLFTSLPFYKIENTNILLSLFLDKCEDGYSKKYSPEEIVNRFFTKHTNLKPAKQRLDLLFRFTQFIERQVVLFDALEDAAFGQVHDTGGAGTLKQLMVQVKQENKQKEFAKKLEDFSIRMVLTAHPTQFYPGQVLGIINDLSKALEVNNINLINSYLQQLGKTAFLKKQKPTPYDEAISLIWFLENVFYTASGRIVSSIRQNFPEAVNEKHSFIDMGFWPGGDRDGNPFVDTDITLKVADALRSSIIKCYYLEVRKLRRRLTFRGIEPILLKLEEDLYNNLFIPGKRTDLKSDDILKPLYKVKKILEEQHNGLFLELAENFIDKVGVFGLHFAALDIRQDASVHIKLIEKLAGNGSIPKAYMTADDNGKINILTTNPTKILQANQKDPLLNDTIASIKAVKTIQENNGTRGCERYIISHCTSALNVMEVYGLFLLCGWKKKSLTVDIVPLFETVTDLENAQDIMQALYENKVYRQHLAQRNNVQTIMLGFSDGTKDGGYLMANWGIYKAKESLTTISKKYNVNVVFFDGRGGPPARGGGKTHQFYASMGKNISNKEIQLTVQGQTVSSNFGTVQSGQYNMEQMINAGISNSLFSKKEVTLQPGEEALLQQLANNSFAAYTRLKKHPYFLDYLSNVSPLKYYGQTNIGSRPAKRSSSGTLTLNDLRAIPFVGSWSQLKQNVTGYFGVGTALQAADEAGQLNDLKKLYKESLFFKTMMNNCEMSMTKCYFPLTQHLQKDKKYGELWQTIYDEYERTKKYVFLLSGKKELLADYPVEKLSISMRERIVLPLVTIQQYAIAVLRKVDSGEMEIEAATRASFEKLIMRSSFGIINAGRNSA
jgi:phosphoenolpyruvate carboxylase